MSETPERPPEADEPVTAGEEPAAEATPAEASAGNEAESEDYQEKWLRAEAELVNYRRRALRDRQEAERRAKESVLAEVLSLADDLERALDAAEQREESGPIFQGVRLVHERVREILRNYGIEVIDPRGRPFDPHEAEAMMEVETGELDPGTVVQVVEKGYRWEGRLMRPARVTVAKAPAESV